METVYDWITVAIFGALVVLFLHRSVQPGEPQDTILHYLPPSIGCAVANWFGNEGQGLVVLRAGGDILRLDVTDFRPEDRATLDRTIARRVREKSPP